MPTITQLAESFARSQKAEARSPHTIHLYRQCILRLARYLNDDTNRLTRRELTDFLAYRTETVAPATVWTDWKCQRVFIRWLVEEDELPSDPMAKMKPPRQPIVPVPVLTEAQIAALLAACNGPRRRDKRDLAIIRLALDTGARRGELAALRASDVDLDEGIVRVTGKGKTRIVPIGSKTTSALDRHMRTQTNDPLFGLTPSGIAQAFTERAKAAGLNAHLHMTRHTFAHRWMAAAGSETDLLTLGGWSPGSRSMLDRYGASARTERAIAAHRRLSIGDAL